MTDTGGNASQFDSGDESFLQRGSPTPTSLATVARISFNGYDIQVAKLSPAA